MSIKNIKIQEHLIKEDSIFINTKYLGWTLADRLEAQGIHVNRITAQEASVLKGIEKSRSFNKLDD